MTYHRFGWNEFILDPEVRPCYEAGHLRKESPAPGPETRRYNGWSYAEFPVLLWMFASVNKQDEGLRRTF